MNNLELGSTATSASVSVSSVSHTMLSRVSGCLPAPLYHAYLCSAGSKGFISFKDSLQPGYPERSLLLTNVDIMTLTTAPKKKFDNRDGDGDEEEDTYYSQIFHYCRDSDASATPLPLQYYWSGVNVERVPSSCKRLFATSNIRAHLPRGTLSFGNHTLKSIDISGLKYTTRIPEDFMMSGCCQAVDFTPLQNVHTIPFGFLNHCILSSISFTSFKNVTIIPGWFLVGCMGLKHIDFSGFENVTTIGEYFLASCSLLESVDLTAFGQVTSFQQKFLSGTDNLRAIDMSSMTSLEEYPFDFPQEWCEVEGGRDGVWERV